MHAADHTTATAAREHLSGLLSGLLERVPGSLRALLGTMDGLKLAYTNENEADELAASISALFSLARAQFKHSSGGVRQVVVEHDAGSLFVMSAGMLRDGGLNTVLAVVATPAADPGQVGHEMETLITGLDEHLVTQARRNSFSDEGL